MRWFGIGKTGGASEEDRQRQEASVRSLESGGIPLNAVDRLREQAARQGTPGHLFTSDLSVNELGLIRNAGYEPLGQVMGSSIYHMGWQWRSNWSGSSGEMGTMTEAHAHVRRLALGRMQREALVLGATGVVGVRLERKNYEWGVGLLEFIAIGTAIRETGARHPPGDALPFLSDLSGEEFWLLRSAGYRPVGFVAGNCSYYQVPTYQTQQVMRGGLFAGGWQNVELPEYTQSVYQSRALAMSRMQGEAHAVGAGGMVGVQLDFEVNAIEVGDDNSKRTDLLYHFTALGTAVVPAPPVEAPHEIRFQPIPVVPLR